jgi:hypothetical protein
MDMAYHMGINGRCLGSVPEWAIELIKEMSRARLTKPQKMMIRKHLRAILVILGYIEK